MDPNNNNFVDLGGSSNSDSSQGQSQSSSNEEPSTQVMDEADRVNDDLLQECQEEDPNAWAKLEAINRAYKNIILTQDETSFGKQGVDYDITSEFAHASSRNDAAIMSSQLSRIHFVIKRNLELDPEDPSVERDVFIQDLSTNGTFINEEKVAIGKGKKRPLVNQDIICLSNSTRKAFKFHILNAANRSLNDSKSSQGHPQIVLDKYIIKTQIGEGGCGKVYCGYDRANGYRKVAIKCLGREERSFAEPSEDYQAAEFMNEVEILTKLNHPCVIRFMEAIESEGKHYIVMEMALGGELFDYIRANFDNRRFNERVAKLQFFQILKGIEYIHGKNVVHRDIKLENLLMAQKSELSLIKISDFGLSKKKDTSLLKSFVGTECYLAPEMIRNVINARDDPYTEKVDMWSLGCILYSLLSGMSAFVEPNQREKIRTGSFAPMKGGVWVTVSDVAKDLVRKLLRVNPDHRLTSSAALDHAWFTTDAVVVQQAFDLMQGRRVVADLATIQASQISPSPLNGRLRCRDVRGLSLEDNSRAAALQLAQVNAAKRRRDSKLNEGSEVRDGKKAR